MTTRTLEDSLHPVLVVPDEEREGDSKHLEEAPGDRV